MENLIFMKKYLIEKSLTLEQVFEIQEIIKQELPKKIIFWKKLY